MRGFALALANTLRAYERMIVEYGVLSDEKLKELGADSLLAVDVLRGATFYPGFQVGADGRIRAAIPGILAVCLEPEIPQREAAQWICTPTEELEGGCLVDRLDGPRTADAMHPNFGVVW